MKLVAVERGQSTETAGCIRISTRIAFDDGEEFDLWVDVPEACAEALSDTGNPWLVAMLPIAASRGEAIQMSLAVDALLLENIRGILAIWREWYPELHDVRIDCPILPYQDRKPGNTAAFFSGGIDSYFTVARRMPGNPYGIPAVGKLDDLITVWGFDVGVHDEAQFRPLARQLEQQAMRIGLNHIVVRTNLREPQTVFRTHWGPLTFGTGLAFIGLLMEARLDELALGSSYAYGSLVPWGSHPMLDPLFSTSGLKIVHDGACHGRFEKTAVVAKMPPEFVSLHVCQAQLDGNCSDCEKCFRTMLALDILGQRERFSGHFDWSGYSADRIRSILIGRGGQVFYGELLLAAQAQGRKDISSALVHALKRSRALMPILAIADWLHSLPWLWRAGNRIRALVSGHSIAPRYVHHASARSAPSKR